MTPSQDLKAKKETARILGTCITDGARSGYPDEYYELHYLDLEYGKNIYKGLKKPEIDQMMDEVFSLISGLEPTITAVSINKLQMKKACKDGAYNPKCLAMHSNIAKFSEYLDRHGAVGSVVFDEEEYKNDIKLRKMIQDIRRNGVNIYGANYQPAKDSKLENVLNTVLLCPSESSPGIQCADFISRAVWQHREKNKSRRYDEIEPLWERAADAVYSDTIFPAMSKWK